MAFLSGEAFRESQNLAANIRKQAVEGIAFMAANSVSANSIIGIRRKFISAKDEFNRFAAVPGIADYARNQHNDPSYDVIAEYTLMKTAIDGVITWIADNFPADDDGYILKDQLTPTGTDVRAFTSAATAGFRTELQSLVDTIAE